MRTLPVIVIFEVSALFIGRIHPVQSLLGFWYLMLLFVVGVGGAIYLDIKKPL